MKNIFIIHGTEGHPGENWFPWLKEVMEQEGYSVFIPQFPSPPIVPAKLNEWFKVFANYQQDLNEESIIIGHSLGGKFALRMLEKIKHKVKAVILVGTPIGIPPILNNERVNAFTGNDFNWNLIKEKSKQFIVFQSDNDPYVGLENGTRLAKYLGTNLTFIPNAGHFNKKAGYIKFEKLRDAILKIE